MVVLDIVDALLVSLKAEVGDRTAQRPDFNGMIKTSRCEGLRVFRVDSERHDVVCVSFEDLPVA